MYTDIYSIHRVSSEIRYGGNYQSGEYAGIFRVVVYGSSLMGRKELGSRLIFL